MTKPLAHVVVCAVCLAFGVSSLRATPSQSPAQAQDTQQAADDTAADAAVFENDAPFELQPALEHDPVVEARPELEVDATPRNDSDFNADASTQPAAESSPPADSTAEAEVAFEAEPEYRADQLVEPSLLTGPSWQIDPIVPVRGYLAQFRLATDYGYLQVQGRAELAERIFEIEVVEQLTALSRSRAFVEAVEHSGKDIGQMLKRIGTQPLKTLKSIPSGLMRSIRSKWRLIKEETRKARDSAAEELTEDDDRPGVGPQAPEVRERERDWWERSAQSTGKLAKRWIGFSGARRDLAKRLGVDPYSRNPLLNRELDRVAWASLAGTKSLGAAIDTITPGVRSTLSWSRKLDHVVWDLDPVALGQQQRDRLRALCGEEPMIDKAMHQGALSPSQWQRTIDTLEAMRVERCGALLTLIATTETDAESRYLVRALELLEANRDPGAAIDLIFVGQSLVARIDMRLLVVPLPLDVLSWTEPVAALFNDDELLRLPHEVWLDGEATGLAQRELTRRGFSLRLDLPRRTQVTLPMPQGNAPQ